MNSATPPSTEQSLLHNMLHERDAQISSLRHQLRSIHDNIDTLQKELVLKSQTRKLQREEHSHTIQKLKEQHSDQRRILARYEQNVIGGGSLRIHEYAALMRSANSEVESSYVIRLQAQLCRAMHSLGVMESQLALVKENCSSLIKFMKEDLSHMVDDRTYREVELMNTLAVVDAEKRVVQKEMAYKLKQQEELLESVRDEFEELGFEYDEDEVQRALEMYMLKEQMEKIKQSKDRVEKELLQGLLEKEEQIVKLKHETQDLEHAVEVLKAGDGRGDYLVVINDSGLEKMNSFEISQNVNTVNTTKTEVIEEMTENENYRGKDEDEEVLEMASTQIAGNVIEGENSASVTAVILNDNSLDESENSEVPQGSNDGQTSRISIRNEITANENSGGSDENKIMLKLATQQALTDIIETKDCERDTTNFHYGNDYDNSKDLGKVHSTEKMMRREITADANCEEHDEYGELLEVATKHTANDIIRGSYSERDVTDSQNNNFPSESNNMEMPQSSNEGQTIDKEMKSEIPENENFRGGDENEEVPEGFMHQNKSNVMSRSKNNHGDVSMNNSEILKSDIGFNHLLSESEATAIKDIHEKECEHHCNESNNEKLSMIGRHEENEASNLEKLSGEVDYEVPDVMNGEFTSSHSDSVNSFTENLSSLPQQMLPHDATNANSTDTSVPESTKDTPSLEAKDNSFNNNDYLRSGIDGIDKETDDVG